MLGSYKITVKDKNGKTKQEKTIKNILLADYIEQLIDCLNTNTQTPPVISKMFYTIDNVADIVDKKNIDIENEGVNQYKLITTFLFRASSVDRVFRQLGTKATNARYPNPDTVPFNATSVSLIGVSTTGSLDIKVKAGDLLFVEREDGFTRSKIQEGE